MKTLSPKARYEEKVKCNDPGDSFLFLLACLDDMYRDIERINDTLDLEVRYIRSSRRVRDQRKVSHDS